MSKPDKKNVISKSDRMKRSTATVTIACALMGVLIALLYVPQYFPVWLFRILAVILLAIIIVVLAYGSVWTWIYNWFSAAAKRKRRRK
ncbi:MAG: hypothetical protein WCZ89_04690 [Phycisphaerae bacterium]